MNLLSNLQRFLLIGASENINPLKDPEIKYLTERVERVERLAVENSRIAHDMIRRLSELHVDSA